MCRIQKVLQLDTLQLTCLGIIFLLHIVVGWCCGFLPSILFYIFLHWFVKCHDTNIMRKFLGLVVYSLCIPDLLSIGYIKVLSCLSKCIMAYSDHTQRMKVHKCWRVLIPGYIIISSFSRSRSRFCIWHVIANSSRVGIKCCKLWIQYVQEVVSHSKILNRTILSNLVSVT